MKKFIFDIQRFGSYTNKDPNKNVNAGEGDDYISNSGSNVTIYAGAGNDTVENSASQVTIYGGAGDDYIYNDGDNITFKYNKGDGNDTVKGFSTTSTLLIVGDSEYSTATIDNDVIVTFGEGKITLEGAKDLPTLNIQHVGVIIDNETANTLISGTAYADSIENKANNVTVSAGEGNDSIINSSSTVSIDGGNGDNTINLTGGEGITVDVSNGNDVINVSDGAKALIENFSTGDEINLAKAATLTTTDKGIAAGDITIAGVNNIATIINFLDSVNDSLTYNQETIAGATIDGAKITHVDGGKEIFFTLSGVKLTAEITSENNVIKLTEANLNGENVTLTGEGYTLALASDVDTTKDNISKWTKLSGGNVAYLEGGTGEYYSLNDANTTVTYNESVAGANKVELSGVKDTLTLNKGVVSLTANNFKSNVRVKSNAGGYSFTLSGDFQNKTFTGTANADKIKNIGSNLVINGGTGNDSLWGDAGSDTFYYAKGDGKDTIYGFDSKDTLTFDNLDFTTTYSKSKGMITFNVSGGSITLKEFTAKTFHIDNDIYKISGSKLVKK